MNNSKGEFESYWIKRNYLISINDILVVRINIDCVFWKYNFVKVIIVCGD